MRLFLYKKRQREISELKSIRIIRHGMEEMWAILTSSARLTKLVKLLHKIFSTIDWLGTKCRRYEKPTVSNILLVLLFKNLLKKAFLVCTFLHEIRKLIVVLSILNNNFLCFFLNLIDMRYALLWNFVGAKKSAIIGFAKAH